MKSYKEKMIPAKTIVKEVEKKIICPDDSNDACINQNNSNDSISGKININLATKEELSTLPSIGESKAQNIIDYRKETPFETIDDIKNVKGIGDSLFEKIKDYIEV
jgi:competence protein ComEA